MFTTLETVIAIDLQRYCANAYRFL